MPIYGYRCEQCGHEVEVLQSMRDEPLKVCPNCMGPLRKQIYAAGIIYKGSGYYSTDYKSTSSKSGSREDSGSGTSTAEKADTDSSSKPTPSSDGGEKKESKTETKSAPPKADGGGSSAKGDA